MSSFGVNLGDIEIPIEGFSSYTYHNAEGALTAYSEEEADVRTSKDLSTLISAFFNALMPSFPSFLIEAYR
jgi:hypothetical protein